MEECSILGVAGNVVYRHPDFRHRFVNNCTIAIQASTASMRTRARLLKTPGDSIHSSLHVAWFKNAAGLALYYLSDFRRVSVDRRKVEIFRGDQSFLSLCTAPKKDRLRQLGTPHLEKMIKNKPGSCK